ncbi:MAG: SMR family transporter [Firmicutes bacterium]|nr:SMR family transporter [Bacillota bacterium]
MLNISKSKAYVVLAISIALELIGDALLEACNGFENIAMGICSILMILLSFSIFSKILHIINIAVAYATWTVVGVLFCTFLGVFYFKQELTPVGWISVAVLTTATFVINMWGTPKDNDEDKEDC